MRCANKYWKRIVKKEFTNHCDTDKMKITSSYLKLVLVVFICFAINPIQGFSGNIIDTTDYAYWRQLACTSEMFGAMKSSAIETARAEGTPRDVLGANALAYILDPDNKTTYIANIQNKFETRIKTMKIGTGAASSSVPSHELFHGLLALDVIRYDLEPEVLVGYEKIFEKKIFKLVLKQWRPHGWAMRMLWYKYAGDEANFLEAKKQYDIDLRIHFLPDGISPSGGGYNMERFNVKERAAKNTTFDIMEYMGYHEYYTDSGMINMHEAIYGYENSPFGRCVFYGDSRGSQVAWSVEDDVIVSPTTVRAARFSDKAYKYAMWTLREGTGLNDATLKGYLASYIVMAGSAAQNNPIEFNIADAEMAPSRIFDNYAALIGNKPSRDALYLSVQTLTGKEEYHTHYEANAIGMAGYGEILLRNAGYDGPNADVSAKGLTTPFEFIHAHAESANTVLIAGENHSGKLADGIVEGFTGENVEYFRASNSTSIKGEHLRDVLFVQPTINANGYYVVMDHVSTENRGDSVNVVWHPNTAKTQIIQDKTAYFSKIKREDGDAGPVLFGENTPVLKTFLGTPSHSVQKKEMVNQSRGNHYRAEYLYATYPTHDNKANILTVLFPGDKTHIIGDMTRIATGSYSGCQIRQGEVVDLVLNSGSTELEKYEKETFNAEDIFYRKLAGKLVSYFVKGTSFKSGEDMENGFKSDAPLALYMNTAKNGKGSSGKIISSGASVTFYNSDVSSVKLNGNKLSNVASGENWVRVRIPQGTYTIELVANNVGNALDKF